MGSFRLGRNTLRVSAFVFLILTARIVARPFNDALFEKLDETELEAALRDFQTKSDEASRLGALQVTLFLSDLHRYQQHIHTSRRYLDSALDSCAVSETTQFSEFKSSSDRALFALTCALAEAEALREGAGVFNTWRLGRAVDANFRLGKSLEPTPSDRMYAEGRVYGILPAALGQNFGKSLLAFLMLSRMEPDRKSSFFWLGRVYQIQGNLARAKENYALAESKGDPRVRYFYREGDFVDQAVWNDGLSYGLHPLIFFSPTRGFGGQVGWSDDRLGDFERSPYALVSASTRGTYTADAGITDADLLPGNILKLQGNFLYGYQDFYGLGPNSSADNRVGLLTQRWNILLSARKPFLTSFFFELGWQVGSLQLKDAVIPNVPDGRRSTYSGPEAQLGYDDRDSHVWAHTGTLAYVKGYFPQGGLGADRSVQNWSFHAEHHLPINFSDAVHLSGHLQFADGDVVPFALYPRLGDEFAMPGVRPGRFQDRALLAFNAETNLKVWGPLSAVVFANLATVASGTSALSGSPYHWGGGAGVVWQGSGVRSEFVRFEVGRFGEETVVQFAGGQAL